MHRPVLLKEVVDLLNVQVGGIYVDGTLGSGGHAAVILERMGTGGRLIGMDRDEEALERSRRRLQAYGERCVMVHGNYGNMADIVRANGVARVNGILLDLGVSTEQLESSGRGFSFMNDGPLDMRMDRSSGLTAADLVNSLSEEELGGILKAWGEERSARKIARRIVNVREKAAIGTTRALAELVEKAVGGRRGRIHPATRTFQALRMAVNAELDWLGAALTAGLDLLAPGGRMAVISFHSLEDRMVKRCFAAHAGKWESLQAGGERWVGESPRVTLVTRKPVTASEEEVRENPASRSAKLRVAERVGEE